MKKLLLVSKKVLSAFLLKRTTSLKLLSCISGLGMLAIMMLVVSGCGDTAVAVNPPTITSYQFTKDQVAEFIDGSVSFYAPDSDIDTMTVVVYDSRGYEISRSNTILNLPAVKQGTVLFSIDYITFPADKFTFSIFLTDFNGYTSNQIVDTFWVP